MLHLQLVATLAFPRPQRPARQRPSALVACHDASVCLLNHSYTTYYCIAHIIGSPPAGLPAGGAARRARGGRARARRAPRRPVTGHRPCGRAPLSPGPACACASRARASNFTNKKRTKQTCGAPCERAETLHTEHRQSVTHDTTHSTTRHNLDCDLCDTEQNMRRPADTSPLSSPPDPSRPPVSPTPSHDAQPRPRTERAGIGHRTPRPKGAAIKPRWS